MNHRFVSFDPRAAERARALAAQRSEFAADLDESSALISAAFQALARSSRLHAGEIIGAAIAGTALSLLGMYFGIL